VSVWGWGCGWMGGGGRWEEGGEGELITYVRVGVWACGSETRGGRVGAWGVEGQLTTSTRGMTTILFPTVNMLLVINRHAVGCIPACTPHAVTLPWLSCLLPWSTCCLPPQYRAPRGVHAGVHGRTAQDPEELWLVTWCVRVTRVTPRCVGPASTAFLVQRRGVGLGGGAELGCRRWW
jgi:hypothetical protein